MCSNTVCNGALATVVAAGNCMSLASPASRVLADGREQAWYDWRLREGLGSQDKKGGRNESIGGGGGERAKSQLMTNYPALFVALLAYDHPSKNILFWGGDDSGSLSKQPICNSPVCLLMFTLPKLHKHMG